MSKNDTDGTKHFICDDFDLWADELAFFEVDGESLMVWRDLEEDLHAYDATCPHQNRDLERTGKRGCMCGPHDDDTTITCTAHSWEFDLASGDAVNPTGDGLNEYETGIEDGEVFVVLPEEQ